MHIEYQISPNDFFRAAKLAQRAKFARYFLYIFPAMAVYFMWMGIRTAITSEDFSGVWSLGLSCSFLLLFPLLPNLLWRLQYRKNPLLQNPWNLDIDDASLHVVAANHDSRTTWLAYTAFAEDEHSFVLHQKGRSLFLPIPKRELSPLQVTELRTLLATRLPTK